MAKAPFTPDGVAAKVAELYALNQTQLNAQADLVLSNFKDWVDDNFNLTSAQGTYVNALNGTFLNELAIVTSDSLRKRHTVKLDAEDGGDGGEGSKFFRFQKCLRGTYSAGAVNEVVGELLLTITYE
ncbi:hypothetical protein FMM05_20275 [Flavobacterium zepuense]|uniref:Uncharacterized protein n=1 Tax=Flavobacterium zepuense TaxID=2593302 RepID=A0A552UTD8_9FLAO|nr:hypothetical protein [Flavobacterium zepuense]TRW21489.1 hypothetical protein FMM05_20275 [Flavobacterium zepuense]